MCLERIRNWKIKWNRFRIFTLTTFVQKDRLRFKQFWKGKIFKISSWIRTHDLQVLCECFNPLRYAVRWPYLDRKYLITLDNDFIVYGGAPYHIRSETSLMWCWTLSKTNKGTPSLAPFRVLINPSDQTSSCNCMK